MSTKMVVGLVFGGLSIGVGYHIGDLIKWWIWEIRLRNELKSVFEVPEKTVPPNDELSLGTLFILALVGTLGIALVGLVWDKIHSR